jgi:periplasmic protein CpxP/Spy
MKMKMFRSFAATAGVVALCSAALCTVPVMAQGGGGRMQMTPEARVAAIDKAVTLTDDQKTKITALMTADMKKMMDIRSSGEDMTTARPKMMAIRTDENTQIKAMLTDDQKPKFDAYLATMMQGRGPGAGGGAAPTPPPPPPPQ